MRAHIFNAVVLIVCAGLQLAWPEWLRIHEQAPDLTLAAILSIGLTTGLAEGLTAGFIGAYLWGAASDSPLGNLFLTHMSLGLLAGSLRGRVFADRISVAVGLVIAGVAVASLVRLVLWPPPSPQRWITLVLSQSLYSGLLTPPVYLLARALAWRKSPDTLGH